MQRDFGLLKINLIIGAAFMLHANLQAQTPRDIPPVYPDGINKSYVRTWEATAPEQNPNTLTTRSLRDVKLATAYVDGLGRPLQTVIKQGSHATGATPTDLVSTSLYDVYGREQFKYLPFASTGSDGNFKPDAFQQQVNFYNSQLNGQPGETYLGPQLSNWAYAKTNFEASPLSRVTSVYAPGSSWVGSEANADFSQRHSVQIQRWTNAPVDDVKRWRVNDVPDNWATYSLTYPYGSGELFKTITIDEQGKQTIEFKDKDGLLVLKKVQLLNTAYDNGNGDDYAGWICTYYVYDDFNNLRLVIQPKAVDLMAEANNWTLDATKLDQLCFRYEYDKRKRLIRKKVPGAGEVWMVYDKRDRLVMTQDANLRAQSPAKWMVTLYDQLNRPVETGLWNNSSDVVYHNNTASASSSANYPYSVSTVPSSGYECLTKTGYDTYSAIPAASGLTQTFDNNYNIHFSTAYNTYPNYPQQLTPSSDVKGMVTWSQVKVLGTNTWLYTVSIYDDKGRIIQIKSKNISGGNDISTTQYSWSGQPLVTVAKTEKMGTDAQTSVVVTQFSYDDLGRVTKTEKKMSNTKVNNNNIPAYLTVAENMYDKLGQLTTKKLGKQKDINNNYTTTPVQELVYEYNIRGWLLGVNRNYLRETGDPLFSDRYFGYELSYDKKKSLVNNNSIDIYAFSLYNGNIGGMVWKSNGDDERRKYDFTYDASNRILNADFNQYFGGQWRKDDPNNPGYVINFSMQMGNGTDPYSAYDANGNIKAMKQWGLKLNSSPVIDDFTYTYKNNNESNQLLAVTESGTIGATDNKLGDFTDKNRTLDDYEYDFNGNMVKDLNKDIQTYFGTNGIEYNVLNLPSKITFKKDATSNKGTIEYIYDAGGNKLKKVTTDNGSGTPIITTTLYMGGGVYQNDELQFVVHEEGRIRFENNLLHYDYFIKDHLGNVRMVLTEQQQQDIYPAATLEGTYSNGNTAVGYEKNFYNIDQSKIVNSSEATGITGYQNNNGFVNPYPSGNSGNANTGSNSQKLYKLNAPAGANNGVTGLGMTLKVMAGDRIDIHGKSYYFQNASGTDNTNVPVSSIVNGLFGSPGSTAGGHGTTSAEVNNSPVLTGLINTFLTDPNRGGGTVPKAYINYILFDENFRFVSGSFSRVGSNSVVKSHYNDASMQNISVARNGYLYVYVSNESPVNVFFDNLQVVHTRGPLLEETHYYPFGLTMKAICAKGIGKLNTKYKYNGNEYNEDFNINIYEAFYRELDPQIGRWWQIDIKPNDFESPYNSMGNSPIMFNDFLGDTTIFFDMNNEYLGTINDAAAPRRLKVLASAYNETIEGLSEDDLKIKKIANRLVNRLIANLRSYEDVHKDENVISFERSLRITFTGNTQNNAADIIGAENIRGFRAKAEYSVGTLRIYSVFDDNTESLAYSYSANSGPWGYGPIPNGNYSATGIWMSGEGGFRRNNVGFRVLLTDNTTHNRTLLRIHPDGGEFGTQGCIGLACNRNDLLMFRRVMQVYFNTHRNGRIPINVNLGGNPNYTNDGSMERNRRIYLEQQRRSGQRVRNTQVRE